MPTRTRIGPLVARRSVKSEARGESAGRCREREEEGVSLRVDLDATVVGTRLAYHRAVVGERVRVPLRAELVQQRRRAFDVREDEGDGAGRKLGPHAGIIRRYATAGQDALLKRHSRSTGAGQRSIPPG